MFNVSQHIHLQIQLKTIDKEGLRRLRRFLFISMLSTRKKGIERSLNSSISVVSFNQLQPFRVHSTLCCFFFLFIYRTNSISFVTTGAHTHRTKRELGSRSAVCSANRGFSTHLKKKKGCLAQRESDISLGSVIINIK